jgi:hypothetical protein
MANGKCHWHSGGVPRGRDWHLPKWPNKNAPNAMAKMHRKLKERERAAAKRALRLKRMTPEQRRAHDEWQRTHKPGSAKARTADREQRRQNRATRARIRQWEIEATIANGIGVFG